MALANCPRCGNLYNKVTIDCCKSCYEKEEKLLRQTQEYLRKNRNAPKFEVMAENNLEQWMMEKWIADKRITIYDPADEAVVPRCSSCGRETKPGEPLCKTCQFKRLSSSPQKKAPEEFKITTETKSTRSPGMHFKPHKQG